MNENTILEVETQLKELIDFNAFYYVVRCYAASMPSIDIRKFTTLSYGIICHGLRGDYWHSIDDLKKSLDVTITGWVTSGPWLGDSLNRFIFKEGEESEMEIFLLIQKQMVIEARKITLKKDLESIKKQRDVIKYFIELQPDYISEIKKTRKNYCSDDPEADKKAGLYKNI